MKLKKIKVFFTMNNETYKKFEKYTNENYINKSKLIEGLIEDYLKNKNIV